MLNPPITSDHLLQKAIEEILDAKTFKKDHLKKDILKTFYQVLDRWNTYRGDHGLTRIDKMKSIEEAWDDYCEKLTSDIQEKTKSLRSLVVEQPQLLPKNFNYTHILRALFLIVIPELLLKKHLGFTIENSRSDHLFENILIEKSDNDQIFLTRNDKNTDERNNFEQFIVETEFHGDESNSLQYYFQQYLTSEKTLDRYSMAKFSFMLRDRVLNFSDFFFNVSQDSILFEALQLTEISIDDCIRDVHYNLAWWLATCLKENGAQDVLLSVQIQNHVKVASSSYDLSKITQRSDELLNKLLPSGSDYKTRYAQIVQFIIRLFSFPVFNNTDEQTILKTLLPEQDTVIQTFQQSENIQNTYIKSAAILGIKQQEHYSQFICTYCEFPKEIDDILKIKSDALDYFFIANIDFLRQINRKRCETINPTFYSEAIDALWSSYEHSDRYEEKIRVKIKELHDDYTNLLSSTSFSPRILDKIHTIFDENIRDEKILSLFSSFIIEINQKFPHLVKPTLDAFTKHIYLPVKKNPSEKDHYLILYIQNLFNTFQSDPILDLMKKVLWKENLAMRDRLIVIGHLAENQNKTFIFNTEKPKFYKKMSLLADSNESSMKTRLRNACGENNINNINAIANTKDLVTLLSLYENKKNANEKIEKDIIKQRINCLFSSKKLSILKSYLDLWEAKTNNYSYSFFNFTHLISIIKNIEKIQNNKTTDTALDILLSLKKLCRGKNADNNSIYSILHYFFFSTDNNQKTIDDLLKQIKPASAAEAPASPKKQRSVRDSSLLTPHIKNNRAHDGSSLLHTPY